MRIIPLTALLALIAAPALADKVGEVDVDFFGNDIIVEAVADPKVQGVTCHVAYFERGLIDRVSKGNWFEDPSNNSIACRQTGPIVIGDIEMDEEGERVFRQSQSLFVKSVQVRRIYDKTTDTLIYLAHAKEIKDGSAKMSISTVPLYGQKVSWTER